MRTVARRLVAAAGGALCLAGASGAPATAKVVASDVGVGDPTSFWGRIDCVSSARHETIGIGGDPNPTANGRPQGNDSFRRLHLLDGDDRFGERCELGLNNRVGPTVFYREGKRRITYISLRLPPGGFPLDAETWQLVIQMKQVGPAANSAGSPILELGAYTGQWHLSQSASPGETIDGRELWSAPATAGLWTRFAFDVRYSRKRKRGRIRVSADLNGDGDFGDPGEVSPRMRTFTLKVEIRGGGRDGLRPGQSIPSHLRAGIYHNPTIACPPPQGCFIDIDNVQVVRPGR